MRQLIIQMMNERTVILDVDGVILRYDEGYTNFMLRRGYKRSSKYGIGYSMGPWFDGPAFNALETIEEFNNTHESGELREYADIVKSMHNAHRDFGVNYALVTKFGKTAAQRKARRRNLAKYLPMDDPDFITALSFVPMTESKAPFLKHWEGTGAIYVEDCCKNALVGKELGLSVYIHSLNYTLDEARSLGLPLLNGYDLYAEIAAKY